MDAGLGAGGGGIGEEIVGGGAIGCDGGPGGGKGRRDESIVGGGAMKDLGSGDIGGGKGGKGAPGVSAFTESLLPSCVLKNATSSPATASICCK